MGIGGEPCAWQHVVIYERGPARCVDCRLEAQRRRQRTSVDAVKEEGERLARIEAALPPAATIDGQLQRLRNRNRAEDAGAEPDVGDLRDPVVDHGLAGDGPPVDDGGDDDDGDDETAEAPRVASAVKPRAAPGPRNPRHYQRAETTTTRGGSWWTKPQTAEEFSQTAAQRQDELRKANNKRATTVPYRFLDE